MSLLTFKTVVVSHIVQWKQATICSQSHPRNWKNNTWLRLFKTFWGKRVCVY